MLSPLRRSEIPVALGLFAFACAGLAALLLLTLGAYLMRPRTMIVAGAALAALALAGCATVDPMRVAEAANALDPGCYKDTQVEVRPLLVFGWPVPLVSVTHRKVCNPGQAPGAPAPLPGWDTPVR